MRFPRVLVLIAAFALIAKASGFTLTNLYSFSEIANPRTGVIQGRDGNFYGITTTSGTSTNCSGGCGTVFRISATGSFTNLHSFDASDGKYPVSKLVQGTDGNFYGTTRDGGNTNLSVNIGKGTIFRISPTGTFTNLHTFTITADFPDPGTNTDGATPQASLVEGTDGNFYGTTEGGGPNTNCSNGCGTIFRISPNGNFTNIHSFNGADGARLRSSLAQGTDGNFYGTTSSGGTNGFGTIFRIGSNGSFTNLYMYTATDGSGSDNDLVQASDGNFYGVSAGGGFYSYGYVFRVKSAGVLTNLYSFDLYAHGAYPSAGLVQASDGNFYGSTYFGGTNVVNDFFGLGYGTLFQVTPDGNLTNLYISKRTDTAYLQAKLIQSTDSNFYGTAWFAGANNVGFFFRFSVPLSPPPFPINQITGAQITTTNFVLSIPSVAGETYQLQFTTNLASGNWSNVPGMVVSNSIGGLLTWTNYGGATGPQKFYRFVVTP